MALRPPPASRFITKSPRTPRHSFHSDPLLGRRSTRRSSSAAAGVKGFLARVARRREMASARRRQIASYRGPQQKPGKDSGRTRPDGPTRARSRRAGRPRTGRRRRHADFGPPPTGARHHEIGAQAEISCRAEIGPLGAFLRLERGGIDLVIVPTSTGRKTRPEVRNRREGQ